jgi:glycosyltransferase involved in cell wall biosynthesis
MRIACIFDNLRDYRVPLFERLARLYPDMDFIITDQRDTSIKPSNVLPNCQVLRRSKIRLILSEGVPLGLVPKLINGGYDLVFCWRELTWACLISFLVSKLMRKRFIVHSETWCYPRNTLGLFASVIARQITRSCDAIVVPGCKAKEFFIDKFQVDKNKIFLAPYAAFLFNRDSKNSKLKQMKVRKELGIRKKKVILYLSRIVAFKGLDYLLKAFSRLERERDDVFLIIVGTGDFKYKVQKLCALLEMKNVKFVGWIDPTNKQAFYSLCNVFVLPSISMPYSAPCNESWGLVINEAMSMGKPVITTTAAGAADDLVINGINGFVVEEKNVDDLYDALRKMLSDDEMRRRMGLAAKETVYSKFTYDRQAEGIMNAIEYCKPKSNSNKTRIALV